MLARDRDGKPVTDLTRDEITVLENGTPQTLVAFEKVSIPVVANDRPQRAVQVPQDVASNESIAPSRVFVLVLDSHHVSATRARTVKALARQFVESYVGPDDYAGVFSPGALPAATQDFTTDKARLLAAIDQFTGMKMLSAVVEVDREKAGGGGRARRHPDARRPGSQRQRAHRSGAGADRHARGAGQPPRADLGTTQDAAAVQRGARLRPGRRAREGAAERQRRHARDGPGDRGADADERCPVRGRSQGAQLGGRGPAGNAGSRLCPARAGFSGRTVADEQNDSIRTLRSLSESTGGFAAVNRNDFAGAFERIVDESSSYYVVGVFPGARRQAGRVSIDRGQGVAARVSASAHATAIRARERRQVRRTASDVPVAEPSVRVPHAVRRAGAAARRSRSPCLRQRRRGLAALRLRSRTLLASPLPQPGLPIRIQAVVLRGDGRKSDVRLVVEVLGRALRFDEQGGRFNERLELALLTVNDGGHASNGTSIDIDLRLTPEDLGRVRNTGVRWLSALELPPGRHQLRVAGRAAGTGISGMITHDIVVPATRRNGLEMSGVTLTSVPSVLMITKGKPWLDQALPTPPTAARTFVAGDEMVAAVEVYRQGSAAADATLIARIDRRDGSPSGFNERRVVQANGPNSEAVGFPISTAKLPVGRYVLRVTLEAPGSEPLERAVPFEVVGR